VDKFTTFTENMSLSYKAILLNILFIKVESFYIPYNISFNSTGFEWQSDKKTLNIPEYNRISFLFVASSLEPVSEIKYGIRILSPLDDTLLQRTIYINQGEVEKKIELRLTKTSEFNVVIRGLVKFPNRFTNDKTITVWSLKDTGIVYNGFLL
jgi:hypothetical protein